MNEANGQKTPLNDWVQTGASLLDLGCGNGEILLQMRAERSIRGFGVEIDSDCIQHCLECGLDVLQQDLNRDLDLFGDSSFDLVLAKDVLHYAQSPEQVLAQMLRIGKRVVVAFDNYGWWRRRLSFMLTGSYRPEQGQGTSAWYRQQSFKLFSVADFEDLCRTQGCSVRARRCYHGLPMLPVPSANLFSHRAWYLLQAS